MLSDAPRVLAGAGALALFGLVSVGMIAGQPPPEEPRIQTGTWRAWLDSPGGELPFGLVLERVATSGLKAAIINGEERIEVPSTLR